MNMGVVSEHEWKSRMVDNRFTFSNEEKYANIVTTLCLSKCEKESEEMKAEVDGKPMSVNGITDELKETTL